jgi:glycosyltransferase involved in cell wall biosynthesis
MKYVVVIPAKNEEEGISVTLDSILNQDVKPELVYVADDNSTDGTARIVRKYSDQHAFIRYYLNDAEDNYVLGGKIVKIFNKIKDLIDVSGVDYDYIVKMDADISFDWDFMKNISSRIKGVKYGIISGTPYFINEDKKVFVKSPSWHTNGDFKIYNKDCLDDIGQIPEDLGWDTADNILAMQKGWKTEAFYDINYKQTRPIGRYSVVKGKERQGRGAYKLGYNPFYLALRTMHDLLKPPVFMGSVSFLKGYFKAMFKGTTKTLDKEQSRLLRKLLWGSLSERFRSKSFYLFQVLPSDKEKL